MNESNILVRIVIAIAGVFGLFIVMGALVPLFTGVPVVVLNAIVTILQVAIVIGAIYYVLRGRSFIA